MNSHAFVAKLAKLTDVSVGFLPSPSRTDGHQHGVSIQSSKN